MLIQGRIQNGVVVLEDGHSLPEGAIVIVSYDDPPQTKPLDSSRRVQLSLVPSDRPGTLDLTNDRIAELLNDDDDAYGGFDSSPEETSGPESQP